MYSEVLGHGVRVCPYFEAGFRWMRVEYPFFGRKGEKCGSIMPRIIPLIISLILELIQLRSCVFFRTTTLTRPTQSAKTVSLPILMGPSSSRPIRKVVRLDI